MSNLGVVVCLVSLAHCLVWICLILVWLEVGVLGKGNKPMKEKRLAEAETQAYNSCTVGLEPCETSPLDDVPTLPRFSWEDEEVDTILGYFKHGFLEKNQRFAGRLAYDVAHFIMTEGTIKSDRRYIVIERLLMLRGLAINGTLS